MKPIKRVLSSFALLLALSCSNNKYANIDKLFGKWDTTNSPGCALLVSRQGDIIYKRAFGMANITDSLKILTGTKFHVASLTKQITGMAIAILEDERLLDINDDISKYIPELPVYGIPIRIKHLLEHTSGIPEYQYLEELSGMNSREGVSEELFFDLLHSKPSLNNEPGERYIYSNSNYTLLAIIIERVSGFAFPQFVQRRFLILRHA